MDSTSLVAWLPFWLPLPFRIWFAALYAVGLPFTTVCSHSCNFAASSPFALVCHRRTVPGRSGRVLIWLPPRPSVAFLDTFLHTHAPRFPDAVARLRPLRLVPLHRACLPSAYLLLPESCYALPLHAFARPLGCLLVWFIAGSGSRASCPALDTSLGCPFLSPYAHFSPHCTHHLPAPRLRARAFASLFAGCMVPFAVLAFARLPSLNTPLWIARHVRAHFGLGHARVTRVPARSAPSCGTCWFLDASSLDRNLGPAPNAFSSLASNI